MRMTVTRLAGGVGAALLMAVCAGSARASLDSRLTFSSSTVGVGQGVQVMLTITNTGGADVTNIVPLINVTGAATLTAPTPLTSTGLIPGEGVTFVLTASPTGGSGALFFSGYAMGDGPDTAPLRTGTVDVPPAALDAQLTSKVTATVGQGVQLYLTVTNTGGAAVANLKARAWTATSNGTNPQPATVASLAAGAKTVFTWTVTPTAGQVGTTIAFTASAAGDGGAVSPWATSAGFLVQSAPVITAKFTALSLTVSGGPFLLVLTASNSGQATASIAVTTTLFRMTGSGTAATPFTGPVNATASIAGGATVVLTWTVTAKTIGTGFKISNSVFITDSNGGPAIAARWAETGNITVVGLGNLSARLTANRSSASLGQPVEFVLRVTNDGGTTLENVVAQLWADAPAGIGLPTPAALATVAPRGGAGTFTWIVTPEDSRAILVHARASGWTQSITGVVAVTSPQADLTLPGIPAPESGVSFAFPSPARNSASLAYLMAGAGTVTITVYNAAGQLVATIEESKPAGVQSSTLTTADLAPGVYYYRVERSYASGSSDKTAVAKFAVVH